MKQKNRLARTNPRMPVDQGHSSIRQVLAIEKMRPQESASTLAVTAVRGSGSVGWTCMASANAIHSSIPFTNGSSAAGSMSWPQIVTSLKVEVD